MRQVDRPHSLNWFLAPWGQRADQYRTQPVGFVSNVDPRVSGYAAGTPAYEAGGLRGPTVYDWDGQGDVPDELYDFIRLLAGMLGGITVPPKNKPADVAELAGSLWLFFTNKGEGCGFNAETVQATLRNNAAKGPYAVAYAMQELMQGAQCGKFIKNPLSPPADPEPAPVPAPIVPVPQPAPNGSRLPAPVSPQPFPWGWVLGGVFLVAAVGGGIYFATRKPKRENPCACDNPSDVIDVEGFEVLENPYGSNQPLGGVDPAAMALAHPFASVQVMSNPGNAPALRRLLDDYGIDLSYEDPPLTPAELVDRLRSVDASERDIVKAVRWYSPHSSSRRKRPKGGRGRAA